MRFVKLAAHRETRERESKNSFGSSVQLSRLYPSGERGVQLSRPMRALRQGVSFHHKDDDAQLEAKLRAAFAVFDTDGSGALSVDELRNVLARRGVGGRPAMSDDEIQALIDEFDEE